MNSLLPSNSTPLERALEQVVAERLEAITVDLRVMRSAERIPEAFLPWLAWDRSIDQWDSSWPIHIRRARVGSALAIQRIKGTAKSVEDVVASFGGGVVVREWFEMTPRGAPYTFSLTVTLSGQNGQPPTAEFIEAVIAEVHRTKPLRCTFDFTVSQNLTGGVGTVGVVRPVISARLWCRG